MTHVEARKSLGQNWLVDEGLTRKIAVAAEINDHDVVIEIGAGTGALTRWILGVAPKVIAIETDKRLLEYLPQHPSLTVVHADALKVDYRALAALRPGEQVCFIGNLPYYITSALVRGMLESNVAIRTIVITVQLDVALRMIAAPGDMSILAVSVQFYGTPSLLFKLPPSAFNPQPTVESAVLRIVPHAEKSQVDPAKFFEIVRAGFSQPRKQLRNPLAAALDMTKQATDAMLARAGIDRTRRAETLSLAEWHTLQRVHQEHTDGEDRI